MEFFFFSPKHFNMSMENPKVLSKFPKVLEAQIASVFQMMDQMAKNWMIGRTG